MKLAANSDRRTVFAQVLGYASSLYRLSADAFEELMRPHVARRGYASVADAVAAEIGDGSFDAETFRARVTEEVAEGNVRCVVVLDAAPTDLIELAGYLQTVTNDRLDIDLVTVTAYSVGGSRVLVPQLVEPERVQAASVPPSRVRVLNPRLPGQGRGLVTIWNDRGAYLSPQRSVIEDVAPSTLELLDGRLPGEIGQNNYLTSELSEDVLALIEAAYREAAGTPSPGGV